MSVDLRWDGLEELKAALRALPAELTREAGEIVTAAADEVYQTTRTNYPVGPTGNLRARVTIGREGAATRLGATATVTSRAPHAWMYEHGTRIRQTRAGANRGRMPQAPVDQRFVVVAMRARKRMYEKLSALLERHGATVAA